MEKQRFLGIEIGGTKLQLGIGDGTQLETLERLDVDPDRGATGILDQIEKTASQLLSRFEVQGVGIGFGGPVDAAAGRVVKSHQIRGWEDVPLGPWCQQRMGLPVVLGNDCDAAALAEALQGAGREASSMFYVTVGSGVGGGFVCGGRLQGQDRLASEIGHLRPGLLARSPESTVESIASGWGIVANMRSHIAGRAPLRLSLFDENSSESGPSGEWQVSDLQEMDEEFRADLLARCDGDASRLTAKTIAQAASEGNQAARAVLHQAAQTLGWAVAQMITLLAPEIVVVGGGVSLISEDLFLEPLKRAAGEYVFPPLASSYRIAPAALGEAVVVHGAIALAAQAARDAMPLNDHRLSK